MPGMHAAWLALVMRVCVYKHGLLLQPCGTHAPSGALAMTLMRPLSLVKSITLRISNVTEWPRMLSKMLLRERRTKVKPSWRAASSSATSSGEVP